MLYAIIPSKRNEKAKLLEMFIDLYVQSAALDRHVCPPHYSIKEPPVGRPYSEHYAWQVRDSRRADTAITSFAQV